MSEKPREEQTPEPLPPDRLRQLCEPGQFQFSTTTELEPPEAFIGQTRALESLDFGTAIDDSGFNIFALGPQGVGRHTIARELCERSARERPAPSDWCYVNNFSDPHKPVALVLPSGQGTRLKRAMTTLVEELRSALPAAFESEPYRARLDEIEAGLRERQSEALERLREAALEKGFNLISTPAGFAFAPRTPTGEALQPADFEKLPKPEQERLEQTVRALQEQLQAMLRQFPTWQREAFHAIKALNQEIATGTVSETMKELETEFEAMERVRVYLEEVEKDIVEHVELFRPEGGPGAAPQTGAAPGGVFDGHVDPLNRYAVNLLVDNAGRERAPVVHEDLPSYGNLFGRAEHTAHLGALVTDFTLIKAGALHRANGGYLLLDARRVLGQPLAWDSLKRALESGEIKVEPMERMLGFMSTATLEPEPIPLSVKVVLIGERSLYYLLAQWDPDFLPLFKVAADFEGTVERTPEAERSLARLVAGRCRDNGLLPVDRNGVAKLVEEASRSAEDSERLSLRVSDLDDVLREANHLTRRSHQEVISGPRVEEVIARRIHRVDRVRERSLEAMRRGDVLLDVSGEAIGQVNGLAVLSIGGFSFGRPSRITVTARIGAGKVIDIERETELGGPIHSKGVFILSNYLAARFAGEKPLSMAASIAFEQSYGMVDGDSASLAELCALLSALGRVPIRQNLAMTGSVNQFGEVQPIGGVNEKVEGFFDTCGTLGRAPGQGVLIPAVNVKHLMLRMEVVEAARADDFRVYPVASVDEALSLLTGRPAAAVFDAVAQRLDEFNEIKAHYARQGERKDGTDTEEAGS